MCMECLNTLAEISYHQEQLKKAREFEIRNICRTCGHFVKDEWGDLVGDCEVKGLSVSGADICNIGKWEPKKE